MPRGNAYIQSTFNNTLVTITDPDGNVISWSSSGVVGFKGSRKSTPFAATQAADDAAKKAMEHGLRQLDVVGRFGGEELVVLLPETAKPPALVRMVLASDLALDAQPLDDNL